ncbi:MAG: hypothetical protein H0V17_01490 [Deltaproteobacteria bacterium]|nr:hypothetical protein [Deltaproteobacteria bacterium]
MLDQILIEAQRGFDVDELDDLAAIEDRECRRRLREQAMICDRTATPSMTLHGEHFAGQLTIDSVTNAFVYATSGCRGQPSNNGPQSGGRDAVVRHHHVYRVCELRRRRGRGAATMRAIA